jgi:hypothetical protein
MGLRVLSGASVLAAVAPMLAVIGLVLALPACCCGGGSVPPIVSGPPGAITGRLILPPPGTPQAATVYAVRLSLGSDVVDAARYAMTRVVPPDSNYSLTVPTGIYDVIARFDTDPLRFGGYTYRVQNKVGNGADTKLVEVRVSAQQRVGGVDIGDWGSAESTDKGWRMDVYGLPLTDPSQASPSVTAAQFRQLPAGPDPMLSSTYVNTAFGVRFLLPFGWGEVKAPARYISYSAFFANETVVSPISLDSKGVWLSIFYGGISCPIPDSQFVVAYTSVAVLDGTELFYFEDSSAGYTMLGGAVHGSGKQCVQFIFKGSTKAALESNLATFVSLLDVARFA